MFGFQDDALQEKKSAIFKSDHSMVNFDSLHDINIHLLLCICINYYKNLRNSCSCDLKWQLSFLL